jgi:hypothetical protein
MILLYELYTHTATEVHKLAIRACHPAMIHRLQATWLPPRLLINDDVNIRMIISEVAADRCPPPASCR